LASSVLQGSLLLPDMFQSSDGGSSPQARLKAMLNETGELQSFIQKRSDYKQFHKNQTKSCKFCSSLVSQKNHHPFVSDDILYRSVPRSPSMKGDMPSTEYLLKAVNMDRKCALYQVKLHSGKTHQIRIHFADAGFPVVGDPYYNPWVISEMMQMKATLSKKAANADPDLEPDLDLPVNMSLQACSVTLPHPSTTRRLTAKIPMPDSWMKMMG